MGVYYVRSKSGTVLWLMKLALGVITLWALYSLIKPFIPVFKQISEYSDSFGETISQSSEYFTEGLGLGDLTGLAPSASDTGTAILSIIPSLSTFLAPLFFILDAIGATMIWNGKGGTGLVKFVHTVSAVIAMVTVIDLVFFAVKMIAFANKVDRYSGSSSTGGLLFTFAISILIYIGIYCYHKDIAIAMGVVGKNLKGPRVEYKKTHLSGLSITAGVFWLLVVLGLSTIGIPKELYFLPFLGLAMAIKQFVVAGANKGLKEYNKNWQDSQTDEYEDPMSDY